MQDYNAKRTTLANAINHLGIDDVEKLATLIVEAAFTALVMPHELEAACERFRNSRD